PKPALIPFAYAIYQPTHAHATIFMRDKLKCVAACLFLQSGKNGILDKTKAVRLVSLFTFLFTMD
ncbi:MAG: hypothetical protein WDA04_07345, partial [Anaerolineaceae bacterium]